jgi:hypothetical protein
MMTEIPAEEKQEIDKFCGKLKPLDYASFKEIIAQR